MILTDDTIVAVSTAAGVGARGIVRLSGPEAETLVRSVSEEPARSMPWNTFSAVSATLDLDALRIPATIYLMRAPRSYTRQDVVEVHTFGAPPLLKALLDHFARAGARPAGPGEFTRRAFLNGRIDLVQAEAVQAIVRAHDATEYRAAQEALAGGFSRRVREIREQVADLAAHVEVSLDFSDQEVEIISLAEVIERLRPVREALRALLEAPERGRISDAALRVALFGPTNAGKSSLFNALLRREHAIVSPEPGVTRDTLEARIALHGVEVRLVDTAGLRPAADPVEQEAVARSERAARIAELGLCVLDGSSPPGPDAVTALGFAVPGRTRILLNKSDLGPPHPDLLRAIPMGAEAVRVSARSGAGLEGVSAWILEQLSGGKVERDAGALLLTARQAGMLREALDAVERVMARDPQGAATDLVASDVSAALRGLSAITGHTVTEDVLDRIFADFCIGK